VTLIPRQSLEVNQLLKLMRGLLYGFDAIAIVPIAFSVWRFYIKFGVFILSLAFLS